MDREFDFPIVEAELRLLFDAVYNREMLELKRANAALRVARPDVQRSLELYGIIDKTL